ncbi:MAG: hypothetical protein ABR543_06710 [Gemmatimonadaceae bacterium]
MSWTGIVAALDSGDSFRSRVSVYLHPLAGWPMVRHVVRALSEVSPQPDSVRVLHGFKAPPLALPEEENGIPVRLEEVSGDGDSVLRALRAAVTPHGEKVLIEGTAVLVTAATIARLLRAGEDGIATLVDPRMENVSLAVCGEGPALASAEDPRHPEGSFRVAATSADELVRIVDRHTMAEAAMAIRDRLVRAHEARGVSFVLPSSTWIDADVRIGPDTVIYPGAVIEGRSEIGSECVIGPYCRIVEATIGRGVELKGWNYVTRTMIRNHAVIEPYVRRGFD